MSATVTESTFTNRKTLAVTGAEAIPMKELANHTQIEYLGHVKQKVVKEDTGETFDTIIVVTPTGNYATRSEAFMKDLYNILDVLMPINPESGKRERVDDDPIILDCFTGKSRNNRDYQTCALFAE